MPGVLRYFALPYWNGRPGEPYPFLCAVDAEEGGAILMRKACGALVYQQWIDDMLGPMDEPEILRVLGTVPKGALWIDPPIEREDWVTAA